MLEKTSIWFERFFQEMSSATDIDTEEAWELVLHCWMTYFDNLREVRVACAGVSIGQTEIGSAKQKEQWVRVYGGTF